MYDDGNTHFIMLLLKDIDFVSARIVQRSTTNTQYNVCVVTVVAGNSEIHRSGQQPGNSGRISVLEP